MLVLITQRIYEMGKSRMVTGLENNYFSFFEKWNLKLLLLPVNTSNLFNYLESFPITHIVLSGGNDINPSLYGQEPKFSSGCSVERDEFETAIINYAMQKKLPVLGICRGMQLINVHFGGQLVQNIGKQIAVNTHLPNVRHSIKLMDEQVIQGYGQKKMEVNSFHDQAVMEKMLSPLLKKFAISEDLGVIEGLYHPSLPIAGIQWHPERENEIQGFDKYLIECFINRKLYWK
jgi:gamma-glutamyl-gamma-aminobutyrate hydrolase PuuD